ncbi:hypothetical protein [Flavobacterium psychroterrae]|uniref:hypothetical protein n=1 Tax=Flavobacterium psychroterrae TaxID=2133767 RepID=UPI001FD4D8CD|nr:hypothetical protein [Flavobacterium psychroterrae]
MKILFTDNAEKTYFDITNKYSQTKADSFAKKTIIILNLIQENNHIGSRHEKTSYRKFLISNHVYLFYKIEIQVIYFILGQQKKTFRSKCYT